MAAEDRRAARSEQRQPRASPRQKTDGAVWEGTTVKRQTRSPGKLGNLPAMLLNTTRRMLSGVWRSSRGGEVYGTMRTNLAN